jgi:uncharacterized protein with HEPN domain
LRRDPRAYLYDILAAADSISAFLDGADFETFEASDMLRSAVERKFEIIGEALNQLAKIDGLAVERITRWRDIVAFRNILAHGYASLDQTLVWRAHMESLPILRVEIEALLSEGPGPDGR